MSHLTQEETKELNNCKTVKDMLLFLNDRFDLNIYPNFLNKILIVNGLKQAIELLKPVRKTKITVQK